MGTLKLLPFLCRHCAISQLIIGGENEDWPVPELQFDTAASSPGVPAGVDLKQFGLGDDVNDQGHGYDLDGMDEITDIDAYLRNKDGDGW